MTFNLTASLLITGLWTGFVATVVMSILMMIGKATGMAPVDMPVLMGRQLVREGAPEKKAKMVGMIMHMITGTIFGFLYFFIASNNIVLQGATYVNALIWGAFLWLIMMIMMMPKMGLGVFGLKKSPKIMVMTLVLHLVYGAVLQFLVML